jgi:hypothetical protein
VAFIESLGNLFVSNGGTGAVNYVSGGEGFVDVFAQRDADHYALETKLPTAASARTSLLVPSMRRLYLAVPRRGAQNAEVRAYAVQ